MKHLCSAGAILVFLPGYDDIVNLRDLILEGDELTAYSDIRLFTLHSSMQSSANQSQVFKPIPHGTRKIVGSFFLYICIGRFEKHSQVIMRTSTSKDFSCNAFREFLRTLFICFRWSPMNLFFRVNFVSSHWIWENEVVQSWKTFRSSHCCKFNVVLSQVGITIY